MPESPAPTSASASSNQPQSAQGQPEYSDYDTEGSEQGSFDTDPMTSLLDTMMTEDGETLADVLAGIRDTLQSIQQELHSTNKILWNKKT